MSYYKVTEPFSSFNTSTGATKTFKVGDTLKAETKTASILDIGSVSGLISSDGYPIPEGYVKEIPNPVYVFAGMGVALVIIAIVLIKLFKK